MEILKDTRSKTYCKELKSKFKLSAPQIPKVFDLKSVEAIKLIKREYANVILEEFTKFIPGTYAIIRADVRRIGKVSIEFKCTHTNCEKAFRISCLKKEIKENIDLLWTVECEDKTCTHNEDTPKSRNFSGSSREVLKLSLRQKSVNNVKKELMAKDKVNLGTGHTIVPNQNVLHMLRTEILAENDHDKNMIFDIVKKAACEDSKFIDLSLSPFRCKLVSTKQIMNVFNYAQRHPNNLRRCHFDATGSIFMKLRKLSPM